MSRSRVLHKSFGNRVHWSLSALSNHDNDIFPHGRGWAYFGKRKVVGLEWNLGRRQTHCGIGIRLNVVDGCDGIQFFFGIPWLFAFWLTFERFIPNHWLPGFWYTSERDGKRYYHSIKRDIGVRVFDQAIWVSLWENEMEWNRSDPWWWRFNIRPIDISLGREKYTSRNIATGRVNVPMPEKEYEASYRLFESSWKRPRWPWTKHILRVEIENDEPIPLPGKGENSWDCDDDACYSIAMVCDGTVEDAAKKYTAGIVRTRLKRCGSEIYPMGTAR